MGGAAQVAMRVASQIWQVIFASQTLQVFCLALRKKAQYVVVIDIFYFLKVDMNLDFFLIAIDNYKICSWVFEYRHIKDWNVRSCNGMKFQNAT
jgi:hypothetical protein